MNWFKENPFLAGLIVATLAAAGVLGYLISQSVSAYSTSSESYTAAVAKLHSLQEKVPFPSEENLKAVKAGIDNYAARIQAFQSQLAKMKVPLDEKITPQQFQDGLRAAVNDIRAKAEAGGIGLPANFYFGFDQYQAQVPTEQAAPALYRQFRVIQTIITRLVDFKVASVDSVVRPPLPEEGGTVAQPAQPAAQKKPDAEKSEAKEPVLKRFPFDIAFTAEQGKFRVAFNSLLGSDQFLIVRSIEIQNTNPKAPSKNTGGTGSQPASNPFAAASEGGAAHGGGEKKSLQVILGRELLKATLHLDMLDFAEPAAPKK